MEAILMADQYVSNTTLGVDEPADNPDGFVTKWYDDNTVVDVTHIADADLEKLLFNGSLTKQTIADPPPPQKAPEKTPET
jgi:hypothetical protein